MRPSPESQPPRTSVELAIDRMLKQPDTAPEKKERLRQILRDIETARRETKELARRLT